MDGEGDKFPVGLRVLVVDDNPACLKILERLLLKCNFKGLHFLFIFIFFSFFLIRIRLPIYHMVLGPT